jgi:hypothetical protein
MALKGNWAIRTLVRYFAGSKGVCSGEAAIFTRYLKRDQFFAQLVWRQEPGELLFLPSLPGISSDPDFLDGSGHLAVESVGEFDPYDVICESLAICDWSHLRPVLPGIGRMEKRAGRASHPDLQAIRCQRSKDYVVRDLNCLPASARITRAL